MNFSTVHTFQGPLFSIVFVFNWTMDSFKFCLSLDLHSHILMEYEEIFENLVM
jgi:hypothetical protein